MKYLISFIIAVLILQTGVRAQEQSLSQLEEQFAEAELTITELIKERIDLRKSLDQKAGEIQKLKSKSNLNYFQHQKLEGLLKESQDISNEIADVDAEFSDGNRRLQETGDLLLELYESEIQKGLTNLETKELTQKHRKTVLKNIEELRKKKDEIKQKINQQRLTEFRLLPLKIEADDTHKQIEQKADLLKDQEDKFKSIAKALKLQKNDLQKELKLRNRIDDLVTDLALFDQQEEILSNLPSQTVTGTESQDAIDRSEGTPNLNVADKIPSYTEQFLVGLKDFDFSVLSSDQLQDIIEELAKQQELAKAKADSLGKQAEIFYEAAKKIKK